MFDAAAVATEPVRQSALSRERASKPTLIRLVLSPEGRPVVDLLGKAPGRGVYVAPEELAQALTPKGLGKIFRGKARALEPEEIAALLRETAERLEDRLTELVGLARRSGRLEIGMDAVERHVRAQPEGTVVVVARDVADRTKRNVEALKSLAPGLEVIEASTHEKLGRMLGRETVGVVATWHPTFAKRIRAEAERRAGLGKDV